MSSDDLKIKATDAAEQVGQSSRAASDTIKSVAQEQLGSARDIASRVGEQAKTFGTQASDAASEVYGRASDNLKTVADSLPNSASEAIAKGQKAGSQLAGQVKKQPLEALLLAAAIGYLVGWATNRG